MENLLIFMFEVLVLLCSPWRDLCIRNKTEISICARTYALTYCHMYIRHTK